MNQKLALVISGGGMSCAYSVGVLRALVEEHDLTDPDIIIAASGSSGTASYFVARQYESISNIWSNLLSTKTFLNRRRLWKIIDIDYLIDEVFKKQDPLHAERIMSSSIKYLVPTTQSETGEIVYFSNSHGHDIFEIMRASMAMPIVFNKKVTIQQKEYSDSILASSTELHIQKALTLGATKIIVIGRNNPRWITRVGFALWVRSRSRKFRETYSELVNRSREITIPPSVKLVRVEPATRLKVGMLHNERALILDAINQGYQDAKDSSFVKDILLP